MSTKMLRSLAAAMSLLVVLCISVPIVRCYEDPYAGRHPLDTLFRSPPSAQKHSGPVPSGGPDGGGAVVASQNSHASLSGEQHPLHAQQQQPSVVPGSFQPIVPSVVVGQHRGVFHRRAAEPGGAGNRHRWHADQRPAVFGSDTVPPFRALPAIDIGSRGSEEDFPDHVGPRPLDTFDLPGPDPSENDIGDGSHPLALDTINRLRVVNGNEAYPGDGGRMTESFDLIREQLERIKQEEDIEIKSNLLMKLLAELPEGPLPIVYIEDAAGLATVAASVDDSADDDDDEDGDDGENVGRIVTGQFTPNGAKRSGRYYRRYPWKRQNSRSRTYDAEARYLCVPSREDVFKLLVGLHENRIGNQHKTISFCNRKRPAKAIFTNIRFLG